MPVLDATSKLAPCPPVNPPPRAEIEVGAFCTLLTSDVALDNWSGVFWSLSAYLSTTVPAATASASAMSVLSESDVIATPPVVVRLRARVASEFSRATPTATDAPTAVLSAETSPFAVDSRLVALVEPITTLPLDVMVLPVPT